MASTSRAHPSQRINNAYVQVPASPLSLASYRHLRTPIHTASSTKLKENTPLRLQFTTDPSTSRKRKLSDCISIHDGPISVLKKAKFIAADETPSESKPTANACPDFPNGFVYCHQCSRKRDISITIQCNVVKQRIGAVERRCTKKYCKPCLKKKYNEDFEGCVVSFFTCPRCKGVCNCWKCKKVLRDKATGPPVPHSNVPDAPKTAKSEKKQQDQNSVRIKAKDIVKPPKKVLPQLKWTPVPCVITKVQVEERIFIREFALRFGHVMGPIISRSSLEELEFIAGKTKNNDNDEMLAWVSEPCLKGLVLGLLGLLAKDHESEVANAIKTAIKTIRSAGVNLNKIWSNLLVLRDNVANLFSSTTSTSDAQPLVWVPLTFPDPLPAPLSAVKPNMRSLRNVRPVEENIVVVHTAQMIPVIISLIHSVLETANIREEIDQGIRDARSIAHDAKEAIKIEKERWEKEKERKDMDIVLKTEVDKNEDKAKGKAHKDRILDINNIVKLTTYGFTSRFSILGMDHDGRTYYALSPGVLEREVGFEYLEAVSADEPRKLKKKGRTLTAEDRSKMKEWSWFVGVWGKKPLCEGPSIAQPAKNDTINSDEEGGEEEVEKWWGFWEPEEIVKVADWIYIKSKLEDHEMEIGGPENGAQTKKDPAQVQLKHLVTQLKDYAALLEWRTHENKYSNAPVLETSSDKGRERLLPGTVSTDVFYS